MASLDTNTGKQKTSSSHCTGLFLLTVLRQWAGVILSPRHPQISRHHIVLRSIYDQRGFADMVSASRCWLFCFPCGYSWSAALIYDRWCRNADQFCNLDRVRFPHLTCGVRLKLTSGSGARRYTLRLEIPVRAPRSSP